MKTLGQVVLTSSESGSIKAWSAQTGLAIWSLTLAHHLNPRIFSSITNDFVYVLSDNSVAKIMVDDGRVIWATQLEDPCPTTLQLTASKLAAYAVCAAAPGIGALADIRVTQLAADKGEILETFSIGSLSGSKPELFTSSRVTHALVFWREAGTGELRYYALDSRSGSTLSGQTDGTLCRVQAGATESGVLALLQFSFTDGSSRAVAYEFSDEQHQVTGSYEIPIVQRPNSIGLGRSSGKSRITRFSQEVGTSGKVEIWTIEGNGRTVHTAYTVAGLENFVGEITDSAMEISANESDVLARIMLATESGKILMLKGDSLHWSRDEGLANAAKMILVKLPQSTIHPSIATASGPLQNFKDRTFRHIRQIVAGLTASDSNAQTALQADDFGFRQYLIAIDRSGRVWAINTWDAGQIIWSTVLPASGAQLISAIVLEAKDAYTKTMLEILLFERGTQEHISFKLDLMSGEILSTNQIPQTSPLSTKNHKVVEAHLRPDELAVEVYENKTSLASWAFRVPQGHHIVARAVSSEDEIIASVGRVLGDRGVLYKHIDQSSIAIISVNDIDRSLTVWLFESLTGKIVYQSSHDNVGTEKPVQLVRSENWLAYHFWAGGDINAYQMVVTELYEGPRNQKIQEASGLFAQTRAYVYDYEVRTMATTTSQQGITSRDLIVALKSNEIAAVSRRLLDPRRPPKDSITAADKEELLIPYEPTLMNDPSSLLSHKETVLGIEQIISGPTLLESTSLVCAFGLDIFITRVTPSMPFDILSDSFSKSQIGISLFVLCAAIAFTRPIAAKKRLNSRWIG